jgi:putative membrane protein
VTALATTAPGDLWTAWSLDPVALAAAAAAIGFFLQGWIRLHRRRPELAPWTRIPLFVAGVAVVLLGLLSPLDTIAEEYLQSAHMLQHVLIADLGIALTLVAVRGPLSLFFLPRDLLAPLARSRRLRASLSFLLRPVVAALEQPLVHRLEHLSFVLVGLLVWTLIVDPAGHGRLGLNGRIGLIMLLFWAGQLLAYVFVFGFEPYYDVYAEQPERLLGLSPLTDQRLAGVVMMAEQALTLGVALMLLVLAARRSRATQAPTPEPA